MSVGEGYRVVKKVLYEAWVEWCKESGRREPGSIEQFSAKLLSLGTGITTGRDRIDGRQCYVYRGVKIRDVWDDQEDCNESASVINDAVPGCANPVPGGNAVNSTGENVSNPSVSTTTVLGVLGVLGGKGGTYKNEECTHTRCVSRSHEELTPGGGTPSTPSTAPSHDLYFTSDMELVEYPHNSAAPVLQVGTATHYRATPSTTVTLCALHDAALLEHLHPKGESQ